MYDQFFKCYFYSDRAPATGAQGQVHRNPRTGFASPK